MSGDGRVRLELRHPWRDGTAALVFDPVEFLGRLAVLVPRPRVNLLLYHGWWGPGGPGGRRSFRVSRRRMIAMPTRSWPRQRRRAGPRGARWAALMARTFGCDVLACPRCGGRLRLISLIDRATVTERILRHVGLPTEVPAPCPVRAPPRLPWWDAEGSGFDAGA